jgi:hypothetical protein
MAWSDLTNARMVTCNNLQDAVNTGVFALKSTIPATNECITKADANAYVYINTSKPSYDAKASNQLVSKQDLEAQGGIVYTPEVGLYPLSGMGLEFTSGTIRNNFGIAANLFIAFNSAGLNSGTVNNDSMVIVPQSSRSISGATITGFGQVIFGTNGLYVLAANTTYNISLTKNDGLGGGSTLRFYWSLCDLCTKYAI